MTRTKAELRRSLTGGTAELNGKERIKVPGIFSLQSSAVLFTIWVTFSPNLSWYMPYRAREQKVLHSI
jgi:hypothetical protein